MRVASVAPARQSRMNVGFLRRSQMELEGWGEGTREKRQRVKVGQSQSLSKPQCLRPSPLPPGYKETRGTWPRVWLWGRGSVFTPGDGQLRGMVFESAACGLWAWGCPCHTLQLRCGVALTLPLSVRVERLGARLQSACGVRTQAPGGPVVRGGLGSCPPLEAGAVLAPFKRGRHSESTKTSRVTQN